MLNESWLENRAELLALQSPYHFLRELPVGPQQERYGTGAVRRFSVEAQAELLPMTGGVGQWLLQGLPWDSTYFGTPSYRLFTGLFDAIKAGPLALVTAAQQLREHLATRGSFYAFSVVPTEDVALLQALTGAGWRLVETRLHFYHDNVRDFDGTRHLVRLAQPAEAAQVAAVSAAARNPYDRFHADPWFGEKRADAFLARYARAATTGDYASAVLVPAVPELPLDSFLAIGDLIDDATALGVAGGMSRILLTAVGPANRGWHVRLVSETIHRARELGHQYVLMTTQATNRAVFRTSEKLGFKLGGASHVLACST